MNVTLRRSNYLFYILILGFALRFGMVWFLSPDKDIRQASFHTVLAFEIAEGRDYSFYDYPISGMSWRAQRPPGYALFFAGLLTFLGQSKFWIYLVHALLACLLIFLAYVLAYRWFGYHSALIAALGVAIYPYYLINDLALTDRLLFNIGLAVIVIVGAKLIDRQDIQMATVMGLVLGLTTVVRGTAVVLAPLIVIWIFLFHFRTNWQVMRNFKLASVFVSSFLIVLMPWFVRNWIVVGVPKFSTNGGFTAWVGNNPFLDDLGHPAASSESPLFYMLEDMDEGEKDLIRAMPEKDWDGYFNKKIWAFLTAQPVEFGENLLRKFYAFWGPTYNPVYYCEFVNQEAIEGLSDTQFGELDGHYYIKRPPRFYMVKNLLHIFSYLPIVILAVWGRKFWCRLPGVEVVFFMFLGISGIHILTVSQTMYRTPLDFFLIIFAAGSLAHMKPQWFGGDRRTTELG